MTDVTYHEMSVEELGEVLSWAAAEGWNPGLDDASAFHTADRAGFFMARRDGDPVAAISVVNHDAENAFLGLYICRPEWRGKGIGYALWNHALTHAGERSVGLDGVPEQEANYAISGFVRTGRSLRHEGRWPAGHSGRVRAAKVEDGEALIALDTAANGFARPEFMTTWIDGAPGSRETRVLEHVGEVAGFATWRACGEGTKIGPIVAPTRDDALELIADIAELRPDGKLIVDVPEANEALCRALEGAGFEMSFATARMYRGAVPEVGPGLQAIATMELG
ncbi:MAG: GNAT family N-acetyltransferase [Pseudomonadota bacterium]